jgi:hypothetical protein
VWNGIGGSGGIQVGEENVVEQNAIFTAKGGKGREGRGIG